MNPQKIVIPVKTRFLVSLILGVALALPVVATAAVAGDLEVTVVTADGKAVAGGALFVFDREIPLQEGGGKYVVKGLPDRRIAVTAEGPAATSPGPPPTRFIGVTEVKTRAGKKESIKVTLRPVTDINAFCCGCHPAAGEPAKADQIRRDLHASGKQLTARYLPQVTAHNEKVARQRREKDPKVQPQFPIPLEERIVIEGGKEVIRPFYTCESCHTLHLKTSWDSILRAPFITGNDMCAGCHY